MRPAPHDDPGVPDPEAAGTLSPDLDGTGQRLPTRHSPAFRGGERVDQADAEDAGDIPSRYEVRDTDDGRILVCKEAPGLFVRLDRSYAFSEQEARKLGERTILVDGAGVFGPLVDDAAHLYNLDHHEDCLRAFTLASCEQALILVLKGLELDRGDWSIYANEPDLDTIFALWVLFNYRRVRELDPDARDRIVPLLRLEGAIDANGFEVAEYCGLPRAVLEREKARLDDLMSQELDAKRSGVWTASDPMEYARDQLYAIDRMVFQASDFQDFESVEEEYGHVDVGGGKVAVVCRDGAGIYDVEKRLKKVWGERLGIIALEKESGQYTLRRAASLSGIDLSEAYERLNVLDPAVDGRPASKRWGGSEEIGGSPRPVGTGLTPREIGKILKLAYRKVTPVERLQRALTAVSWALYIVLAGAAAIIGWRFFGPADVEWVAGGPRELACAAGLVALASVIMTRRLSRGWTWLYGWRRPAGKEWLFLAPFGIAAATAGGALWPAAGGQPTWQLVGAALVAALAVELCLRGLVHGQLVLEDQISAHAGPWFLSRPAWVGAAVHALVVPLAFALWLPRPVWPFDSVVLWSVLAGSSLVCGLILGLVRERSLSLWPGVLILTLGAILRPLAEGWLG